MAAQRSSPAQLAAHHGAAAVPTSSGAHILSAARRVQALRQRKEEGLLRAVRDGEDVAQARA
jgi:hypothetical protein